MELKAFVAQVRDGAFRQKDQRDLPTVREYKELAALFPTLAVGKNTDKELGRRLSMMGYKSKHTNKGVAYRVKEI